MKEAPLLDLLAEIVEKNEQKKALTPDEKFIYLIYVDGMKEHDARDLVQSWFNVQHFSCQHKKKIENKWDLIF